jgi:hypothetical protein
MTVAVAHVNWSVEEITVALDAALAASSKLGGRKQALEQLESAQRRLAGKSSPKARVALHFGERPLGLLGTVLAQSSDPAARSALASLQKAVIEAKKTAKRPGPKDVPLHNPLADTRERGVRHITGRARPPR